MKRPERFLDTDSIPNQREIHALNALLEELLLRLRADDLWRDRSLDQAARYALECLGVDFEED